MYEPLGYGEFPDVAAIARALTATQDMVTELAVKVAELSAQIDGMMLEKPLQTGGFLPRNRRDW